MNSRRKQKVSTKTKTLLIITDTFNHWCGIGTYQHSTKSEKKGWNSSPPPPSLATIWQWFNSASLQLTENRGVVAGW